MKADLSKIYDLNAYLSAARAVASEVSANVPEPNRALLPARADHLASLTDAVQFLLDHAAEVSRELEKAMEDRERAESLSHTAKEPT